MYRARIIEITCCSLLAFALAAPVRARDAPMPAPGDPREDYESATYRTASRRVEGSGAAIDLIALAAKPPLGLPPLDIADPLTPELVALGRRLFVDRRLSFNGTLSCAMCHIPEQGFTHNELATPVGIEGRSVRRNAPALYNVAYRRTLFYDGRETRLDYQVWSPLLAHDEMGNPSIGVVIARLESIPEYVAAFAAAFAQPPSLDNVGRALAAYERTLLSADSPFDRWRFGGEADALSASAARGFAVFVASGCSSCHLVADNHAQFTDDGFHDTGIGYHAAERRGRDVSRMQVAPGVVIDVDVDAAAPTSNDLGRYEVTADPKDRWQFRTPSLRNVALTAPYMHDGSLATLDAVIDYYDAGGVPHEGLDARIHPLGLDANERVDLRAFLTSLTGSNVGALAGDARSIPIGDTRARSSLDQDATP